MPSEVKPTKYYTQTPSVQPTEEFECDEDNKYHVQETYVQYTPLSKQTGILDAESTLDNRQPTLRLRFLFAEDAADPWQTNITNGETPKSPFIGQVLITLTDETQEFRMFYFLLHSVCEHITIYVSVLFCECFLLLHYFVDFGFCF